MISQEFMLVSMLGFLFISLLSGYPVAFTISEFLYCLHF